MKIYTAILRIILSLLYVLVEPCIHLFDSRSPFKIDRSIFICLSMFIYPYIQIHICISALQNIFEVPLSLTNDLRYFLMIKHCGSLNNYDNIVD